VRPKAEWTGHAVSDAAPKTLRHLARLAVCWLVPTLTVLGGTERAEEWETARVLYEARQYRAARTSFERLAAGHAPDAELDFYLGRLALWFDDEAAALGHLERAARLAPAEARIQNALGDAFGLAAQNADLWSKYSWATKCRAAYERAVALEPANPAFHWSLLGYYLVAPRIAGGGERKARLQAEEIRRLDPMGGRIAVATLNLADRKPTEAFAQFDDLQRERPDDFLVLYHVGRCAALSGEQLDRGLAVLRRCLQLAPPPGDGLPAYANVHYRLANILEKKGDAAGARDEYAAALRECADFRPAKTALRN